ncbi:MAG: metal-dependent transcriptional regulator [Bacteroidota bacterium]|jgi:DtxR family Mn-dependent transcriptional regulator
MENYLKCIYNLYVQNDIILLTDLADYMNVKAPSVNSMIKKLAKNGWVKYEPYKPIKITVSGKRRAAEIIRKHRLTEMFLCEMLEFRWDEVHHIAEQIEHINAPEFFERIDMLLGYPKSDPHGSPIPDKYGAITAQAYKRLSDCAIGELVTLKALNRSDESLLKLLTNKNIHLGCTLTVKEIEQYDGSITLKLSDKVYIVLSKTVCDNLMVL